MWELYDRKGNKQGVALSKGLAGMLARKLGLCHGWYSVYAG